MIGDRHGINAEDLKAIAEKTAEAVKKVNNDRHAGGIPYRDLPYDKQMLKDIKKMADQLKGKCKNFVVLGIGGSALDTHFDDCIIIFKYIEFAST